MQLNKILHNLIELYYDQLKSSLIKKNNIVIIITTIILEIHFVQIKVLLKLSKNDKIHNFENL